MAPSLIDRFDAAVGRRHRARDDPPPHAPPAPPRPARGARARRAKGLWAQTGAPPREGNAHGGADRRRERAAADGRGDPRRAAPRARLLVAPRARLRPRPARPSEPGASELLAEAAERVPVRVLVWAGAPVPVFQPRRAHGQARRASELVRGTKIQCELDAARAQDALPPREARDRRRRARVRRRHRPDRAGRRPLRLQRAPAQGGRSAGTTRRAACAGRSCATSPPTSRCAGRPSTGEALALPEAARPSRRHDRPVRPHDARGRLPACSRAASSRCSRPTSARCAAPGG